MEIKIFIDNQMQIIYHRFNMFEIARFLALSELIPKYESPYDAYTYAVDRVREGSIQRIDMLTLMSDGGLLRVISTFSNLHTNKNRFNERVMRDEFIRFCQDLLSDNTIELGNVPVGFHNAVHFMGNTPFSSVSGWEIPVEPTVYLGMNQQGRQSEVLSRSYYVSHSPTVVHDSIGRLIEG